MPNAKYCKLKPFALVMLDSFEMKGHGDSDQSVYDIGNYQTVHMTTGSYRIIRDSKYK